MKRILLLLPIIFLLSCAVSNTDVMQPKVASSLQVKTVKDAPDVSRIDEFIQEYVDQGKIPGGTFYAAHKGKVIYHKSFGDKSSNAAFNNSDIYRIASMTKALTTVSIMQLYEQGKLKLDDPLELYIPAFANPNVLDKVNPTDSTYTTIPANGSITLRQLLTHTSGIYYGLFEGGDRQAAYMKEGVNDFGLASPGMTTIEMANMMAKAPLAHQPGEQWTYGLNMEILGAVVEVVSGQELDVYFDQHIYQPIGMTNTGFNLPESKVERIVPLYTYDEEGNLKIDAQDLWMFPAMPDEGGYMGGGGLSSTAEDYGKFVQVLMDKGRLPNGKRILSRHTAELMTTEQISHLNMQGKGMSKLPGISFCLGHAIVTPKGAGYGPHKPGTFSWGGYFNSKWWVDQEEELVFVGMTNVLPFPYTEFWDKLYPIVYASID